MPYYTKQNNTWHQPVAREIPIDYSIEGLKRILEMAISRDESSYRQFDLANWCEAFSVKMFSERDKLSPLGHLALNIADDVHGTWSIYVMKNITADNLLKTDTDTIKLPESYWRNWLTTLSEELRKENA